VLVLANKLSNTLLEIDLAGNTLRETNVLRVNQQLAERAQPPITGFHHEAMRLANGHTLAMAYVERIFTNVQGVSGEVDILGNMLIDLDENWQVAWTWNAFDHLDINRAAVLGEVCGGVGSRTGCPLLTLAPTAHDWLHTNAIAYSPLDGNLLLSVRHQDWIIKIAYSDGAGNGHVIWRLGPQGDFTIGGSSDPSPWFSHPHDLVYDGSRLVLFDNGNTRCKNAGPSCHSRGQVLELHEGLRHATLRLNADLGTYSSALGAAHILANGNYHFTSGFFLAPRAFGQSVEVLPNGALNYVLETRAPVYRSYRVRSLYEAPSQT
jgi:hypothetical protein